MVASAPTPTPPPSPPAPDDHGLNAAVQKWCQDNSSNDPSVWAADFASQVNYCYYEGSGLASQNFIEEDRRKLVDAWPQRTYTFNTVTSSLINDHQANANVKFDWSYSSPAKGDRSGNCDVELSLTWNGSNWLIDSYQETVHRQ